MGRQRKLNTPEKRARIGERIKVAATQAGFSLKDLAEQTGVSPSAIYQYVRGITAVPPVLLARIALVTRVHESFFDPESDARQTLALAVDAPTQELPASTAAPDVATRTRIETEFRQMRALADAYRSPRPDPIAHLSVLEQMLALSRALDSPEDYARALAQTGQARLAEGHFAAARSNLIEARDLWNEEQTEARARITLDLARCCCELEDYPEATRYLEELCEDDACSVRWQAEILLGRIRFRFGDYVGALSRYGQAAEAVLAQNSAQLERDAQIPLAVAVAQLAFGTGHFEAARSLWAHAGRRAERDGDVATFLMARTELARCEEARGDLVAARSCLQNLLVLTAFLPDAENRQVVARGLLGRIQATVGDHEAARENARHALRTAHRSGTAADNIAAGIALARIRLAGGQYAEALEYSEEALDLARRTDRAVDAADAHMVRCTAYYLEHSARRGATNNAVEPGLRGALAEAKAASEAAERGRNQVVRLEAQWMIAEIYAAVGAIHEAESAAVQYLEMADVGPFPLRGLLNTGTNSLLGLLSAEIDLPGLFHLGIRFNLPLVEWQVHTLRGVLASDAGRTEEAYTSFIHAAQIVWSILSELTPREASGFHRGNPRLSVLLEGLERTAAAAGAQSEARPILERILMVTEQTSSAVVGAATSIREAGRR